MSSPPITDGDPGPVPGIATSGSLAVRVGESALPSWDRWDELNSRVKQGGPRCAVCLCLALLTCSQHRPWVSFRCAAEGAASARCETLATARPRVVRRWPRSVRLAGHRRHVLSPSGPQVSSSCGDTNYTPFAGWRRWSHEMLGPRT